jgi:catechol 2,3-dioxygenase-like lactoylglutathione lyase family enzyme
MTLDFLINIDVPDIEKAERFYVDGLGLNVGRRFDGWLELLGGPAPIYLLGKPAGSPTPGAVREYHRHWTPLHLDIVVDDVDAALAKALGAGALQEGPVRDAVWGRIVLLADPFGHGLCLLQFTAKGYDAILP